MMKSVRNLSLHGAPVLLLFLLVAFRIFFTDSLEEFSFKIFDRFQQMQPRVYQDAPVRFVDLDDESLKRLGQWPWPRVVFADLVKRLSEKGAAVIVLDILFSEPDRTSPSIALKLWPDLPEIRVLRDRHAELPDHDTLLAHAISEANVVAGFTLTNTPTGSEPAVKAGFAFGGDNPVLFLPAFKGAIPNLPVLETAASGNGSFNFIAEHDGTLRRVPLVFRYKDQLYPSLTAEALRLAQGASSYVIKSSGSSGETGFGERTGMVSMKIGQFPVPTDAQGRMWLYDTGLRRERFIPAWRVFEKDFSPRDVEGMIVFIGSSAAGLKDMRATPLNPVAAGTEIHVQLAEQILLGEFLHRPDWAAGAEMLYLIFLGIMLILLLPRVGAAWCAVIGFLVTSAVFLSSWMAYTRMHLLLDPFTPSIATFVLYLTVSLLNFLKTESERRHVRQAFSQYLSPGLLQRLSDSPERLKLGGEMKPMSILFSDIRGFTTISEHYTAQELTFFMNRYLTPMTDLILKKSGTIDKYIGDCIMAFWNAPFEDPEHARHACAAALSMIEHLKTWNEIMAAEVKTHGKAFSPVAIGIGINTGQCCVGNMGSEQRFDYSVLGDDVNLASRLEGQSKFYGVSIMIGENTREAAPDFAALELDLIRVKGKTRPARIYALLGDQTVKEGEPYRRMTEAQAALLEAYRAKNFDQARVLLGKCREAGKPFKLEELYALYESRIEIFLREAPPENWDGVYTAISK